MIFPFPSFLSRTRVPSLGGGTIRYKPIIPITITGPAGQVTRRILVDSGSDDIVFPASIGNLIGVNLIGAPQRFSQGVGGQSPIGLLFAPVILLLQDQNEIYRWRAVVGFTKAPLRFPLFGIAGGLEHFRTTLDVRSGEIELVAQPSLPVTQALTP